MKGSELNYLLYLMSFVCVSVINQGYVAQLSILRSLTDGFVPKHRIMEAGMIIRFHGPKASPLACVAKTQDGVRLACDYQYVNPRTLTDVFCANVY